MVARERLTTEAFDHIASLPENADKRLEFVGGEIVEVVSNNYSSEIAAGILGEVSVFAKRKKLGRVTGADGGYIVSGERYIPDLAFISFARQPGPSHEAYNPNPPDLAVEVLSPTDEPANLRIKIVNYLRAGTVVWVVDPIRKQVEVYAPDQAPKTLTVEDTLDGGSVLPGFELAVQSIFPE
ncbi:MAG: Uma2 family endonuclease [Anaerolineae bacterium]|nr:Uma2 family endonuclease [Anaerolineae bacterium]